MKSTEKWWFWQMELKDKEIKQLKERLAKVESRMKQTLQVA